VRRRIEVPTEPRDEDDVDDELVDQTLSLYCIPATGAPVLAVLARAPDQWWMVARWDLATGELSRGAWLRGTMYARRCDVSPDGDLFYYLLAKQSQRPFMGMVGRQTFSAISKLPWVTALAAWREDGARAGSGGYHFVEASERWDIGAPQHGDAAPVRARRGLAATEPIQYATERRRGWVEHERCPPRAPGDLADELRSAVLAKPRPGEPDVRLVLVDRGLDDHALGAIDGRAPEYAIERPSGTTDLDGVVWADWDPIGRLLVATDESRLEIRDPSTIRVVHHHDLANLEPRPGPAPEWAQRW
jgi:hypothetical protein